MHKIKYSNQAEKDLQNAIDHITEESVPVALDYLDGYEEKIELLRSNPLMGIECKTKLIKRDCRILFYKSHIVFYKVNNHTQEIFIIRIFHHSEDYIKKFVATHP